MPSAVNLDLYLKENQNWISMLFFLFLTFYVFEAAVFKGYTEISENDIFFCMYFLFLSVPQNFKYAKEQHIESQVVESALFEGQMKLSRLKFYFFIFFFLILIFYNQQ